MWLNAAAGAVTPMVMIAAIFDGREALSTWSCVAVAGYSLVLLVIPILWTAKVVQTVLVRRRNGPSAAGWRPALVVPLVAAVLFFAPLWRWTMHARVKWNEGALNAFADRASAADGPRNGSAGGMHFTQVIRTDEGVYLTTTTHPDGEHGLVRMKSDDQPAWRPDWVKYSSAQHLTGRWWMYAWLSE